MELGNDLEGVSLVARIAEVALEFAWMGKKDNVEAVAGTLEEYKVQPLLMEYTKEVAGPELVNNYLLGDT